MERTKEEYQEIDIKNVERGAALVARMLLAPLLTCWPPAPPLLEYEMVSASVREGKTNGPEEKTEHFMKL